MDGDGTGAFGFGGSAAKDDATCDDVFGFKLAGFANAAAAVISREFQLNVKLCRMS